MSAARRWKKFDEDEIRMVQSALAMTATQLKETATPGVPEPALAADYLDAALLHIDCAEYLGEPHACREVVMAIAMHLAPGTYTPDKIDPRLVACA